MEEVIEPMPAALKRTATWIRFCPVSRELIVRVFRSVVGHVSVELSANLLDSGGVHIQPLALQRPLQCIVEFRVFCVR